MPQPNARKKASSQLLGPSLLLSPLDPVPVLVATVTRRPRVPSLLPVVPLPLHHHLPTLALARQHLLLRLPSYLPLSSSLPPLPV